MDLHTQILIGAFGGSAFGIMGGLIGTYCSIWNTNGPREQSFVVRSAIWCWLAIMVFVVALWLTPMSYAALLWLPYVVLLPVGIRVWNRMIDKSLLFSGGNPMFRPFAVTMFLLAVLAVSSTASNEDAAEMRFPEASDVDRVVVCGTEDLINDDKTIVNKDSKKIKRLLAFLVARKKGWRKTWATAPAGKWTITLEKGKNIRMALWVGTTWLGGREGASNKMNDRFRSLTEKDRAELLEILGIGKK
jgi:hypothetical protein